LGGCSVLQTSESVENFAGRTEPPIVETINRRFKMKKIILLTAATLFTLSGLAHAADMPVKPRMAASPPPAWSWSGCYIGGNVGGLRGDTDWIASNAAFVNLPQDIFVQSYNFSSVTAGGQIGCNYQRSMWVFGVEGDLNYADIDRRVTQDPIDNDEFYRTRMGWYGTIRGRAGITWNRVLFYGTGGLAFSHIRHLRETTTGAFGPVNGRFGATAYVGWTAGGGIEWAFANNWSVRGEYLYLDFGRGEPLEDVFMFEPRTRFHVGRLGINYLFGPQ
jgi:outer membrane immunogenic protein